MGEKMSGADGRLDTIEGNLDDAGPLIDKTVAGVRHEEAEIKEHEAKKNNLENEIAGLAAQAKSLCDQANDSSEYRDYGDTKRVLEQAKSLTDEIAEKKSQAAEEQKAIGKAEEKREAYRQRLEKLKSWLQYVTNALERMYSEFWHQNQENRKAYDKLRGIDSRFGRNAFQESLRVSSDTIGGTDKKIERCVGLKQRAREMTEEIDGVLAGQGTQSDGEEGEMAQSKGKGLVKRRSRDEDYER